ncbi:UDP-N-acetylmuramate dehydrogenase [Blastococcus sp. MG754426]|uniref:UDP-N-acetylmuramate dehydrogenase n=1 Tax=unclassified Blastococcus TaxID=2619396 RepID=UPI001EF0E1A4|nr:MULTISPECIES: UDP-N-acetylmuramate dehydrogenase [unclassified Blastococcus]MCF6508542.1 UDP-N-acetylmuramate dehydrogenase [Blastococcus sp. MG754426]MCF6513079.1 UDP-N-acetylmuramate dehydrogenase [Blastococcus sp. MG754427]MCF6737325.1 UDP-N-acetylmuramate dehydrogenase [Blastococcus sp. KM273129]
MQVRSDVPLAGLTTLAVGGPAERLVEVETAAELVAAVRDADESGRPLLLLGGGSNLIAPDEGWPGDVVAVRSRGIERTGGTLVVQAGEDWDALVAHTVEQRLAGVEALSGIPGSTGATPVQNVGAYGQEVAQTITAVRVYDRAEKAERTLSPAECGFAYRDSRLKREPGRFVVLEVTFALEAGELSRPVGYAELARSLGVAVGERAPLAAVRDAVLALRRGKGMVWDAADPDSRSAGSFFTNPIVAADRAVEGCPSWPAGDGQLKLSAAWLVQHAGFGRGTRDGRVGTSSRHSLALTTEDGATAAELLAFAGKVVAAVEERFGVTLEREPTAVELGRAGWAPEGSAQA